MESDKQKKVLMTFDIEGPPGREDFMDSKTLRSLHKVLKLMEKYSLRGLFFINANVIEEICENRQVFQLLNEHEIGFHSSSHSVKPRIFEYTDLPDYEDAMKKSMEMETSRVNPFTGEIVGEGGILLLREVFPSKNIEGFKAPFDYFSPPHTEALRELGFKFAFSCDLCHEPVSHKGLTFYPSATYVDGISSKLLQINSLAPTSSLFIEISKREFVVLGLHPSHLFFSAKHLSFNYRNPMYPFRLREKRSLTVTTDLCLLDLMFLKISLTQRAGLLESSPRLDESKTLLNTTKAHIERNRQHCLSISSRLFGYKPKFLSSQLHHFLNNKS